MCELPVKLTFIDYRIDEKSKLYNAEFELIKAENTLNYRVGDYYTKGSLDGFIKEGFNVILVSHQKKKWI